MLFCSGNNLKWRGSTSYFIGIDLKMRKDFLIAIGRSRKNAYKAHFKKDLLLLKELKMRGGDLCDCLIDAEVEHIEMNFFAQKAKLVREFSLMKVLREADPDCIIRYDVGVYIQAKMMHWGKNTTWFNVSHRAVLLGDFVTSRSVSSWNTRHWDCGMEMARGASNHGGTLKIKCYHNIFHLYRQRCHDNGVLWGWIRYP
eukprot:scaffold58118_cov37-Cyclotella_meneghiniana.AAC.6